MSPVFASITHLGDMQQVIPQDVAERERLLVIFDMDLTLTMPPWAALAYLMIPAYRTKLQTLLTPLSRSEQRNVMTLGLQVGKHQLVEPETPALIRAIQAKGIKTMVLTASLTGQVNHEAPIELQRFEKLKDLGIVFENTYCQAEIVLHDLSVANTSHVLYHKGILCASGEPSTNLKGPALVSFLKYIQFYPNKVIMVDDKKEHLAYVNQSLAAWDPTIQFIGLVYLGVQEHLSEKAINEEDFVTYWKGLIKQVLHPTL